MLRVPGTRGDLFACARAAATCASSTRRSTPRGSPSGRPIARSCSSRSASRPRRPPSRPPRAGRARARLDNFFLLVSHVRVPPALEAIAAAPDTRVEAFLAAGHVCTVMGTAEYEPIARRHRAADRRDRLRAASTSSKASRSRVEQLEAGDGARRDPVPARGAARGQSGRARAARRGVRDRRPAVARHRRGAAAAASRCAAPIARSTPSARSPRLAAREPGRRAGRVSRRRRAARRAAAARVPGLRPRLHARASARRADGVERRRVRGVLPLARARRLARVSERFDPPACSRRAARRRPTIASA